MRLNLSGPLLLNDGVMIMPAADLPEASRVQMECDQEDYVVSRVQSRSSSKVIDARAADLLSHFREKNTVVQAVILFARDKGLEPEKVLETAYPFLRDMVMAQFLVRANEKAQSQNGGDNSADIQAGSQVLGGSIIRCLHVLDDTEVFLLSRAPEGVTVLKIERFSADGNTMVGVRARLDHEAAF